MKVTRQHLKPEVLWVRNLLRRHYFLTDHIINNKVKIISLQPQERRHVCKFRCNYKLSEQAGHELIAMLNSCQKFPPQKVKLVTGAQSCIYLKTNVWWAARFSQGRPTTISGTGMTGSLHGMLE